MKKLLWVFLLFGVLKGYAQSGPEAEALIQQANTSLGHDLRQSRKLADSAYALAGKDSLFALMGRAQRLIGISHYFEGNFDEALLRYTEGRKNCLKARDLACEAFILNEIGTLEKKTGDLKKSKSTFTEALKLAIQAGDSSQIANSLNNLGIVYDRMDMLDSARLVIEESAEIKRRLGDLDGLTYNLDNLGMIAARQELYAESEAFFLEAAEIRKKEGNRRGWAIIINNLGELYLMKKEAAKARAYFIQALEVAYETDFKDFRQHIYNQIHETYLQERDAVKALEYYKYHVSLRDSLFNETKSKQIAEIRTRYETEQKEQKLAFQEAEIDGQRARLERNLILNGALIFSVILLLVIGILLSNRMRRRQELLIKESELRVREAQINSALSSQEKERTRFARDLHDGFGQMISVLTLNIKNLNEAGQLKPETREQIFHQSEQVLVDMHSELKNICFNLMPQTLIQSGLEPAIREFAGRINASGKLHSEVHVFGLKHRLSDLQEISFYRIIQEWVNNILKYSEANKLTIQLTTDEKEITLLIEDNGPGFDPEVLKSGKGNGWKNMTARANLLNGELVVDSNSGRIGSTMILNVPVLKDELQKKYDSVSV